MKIYLLVLISIMISMTGCRSSLYKESIQDAIDARQANLRAIELAPVSDAGVGAGARAFDKVAYCLTTSILRNEKIPIEGGLPCPIGQQP